MALKIGKNTKMITIVKEEHVSTNDDSISKGIFDELVKEVIIPEGITSIEQNAFEGCISLESITLPSSIKYIGPNAFADCKDLKEVVLPDSISDIDFWGERRAWKVSLFKPFSELAENLIKGFEVVFDPPLDWD